MPSEIRLQIESSVKDAMRARDKPRLGCLRLVMSEIKKIEVDERIEVDDTRVLAILDKMIKQRKDSLTQFESAGRQDLVDQEAGEISVISEFMPEALSDEAVLALIDEAIAESGASSMKDMGNLMSSLRPKLQGRADMGKVSGLVKSKLS